MSHAESPLDNKYVRRLKNGTPAPDFPLPEPSESDGLTLERCLPPAPDLIAFRVLDRTGKIRGMIAFEWPAMEPDLPSRTLARVRRSLSRPDLRLVG